MGTNLHTFQKIVAGGENETTEFKHKINFPDKIAREVVAFANTRGGTLYIGVDDNKTIFGLKNPHEEIFAFENMLKKYIIFPVAYHIDIIPVNPKKSVLAVAISEATRKPNYAKELPEQSYGKAYVRYKDKSIQASNLMVALLRKQSKALPTTLLLGSDEMNVLQFISKNPGTHTKEIIDHIYLVPKKIESILVQLAYSKLIQIIPGEQNDSFYEVL